jgi:hypothetical protein
MYDVHFGDGSTERLFLVPLGPGLYRAEESSLLDESILLGTVIAGETLSETEIRFLGVSQKSPYVTTECLIPKELAESPRLAKFLEQLSAGGGFWERKLGGIFFLHLPPESPFDVGAGIERITGEPTA